MKRMIKASVDSKNTDIEYSSDPWYYKYFRPVTYEELLSKGYTPDELESVEEYDDFNAKHIEWLYVKDEYEDIFDIYSLEVVEEGGKVFPSYILSYADGECHLIDATDELKNSIAKASTDNNKVQELVEYYSHQDALDLDDIWEDLIERFQDYNLANEVLEGLEYYEGR